MWEGLGKPGLADFASCVYGCPDQSPHKGGPHIDYGVRRVASIWRGMT
jgi:hypothetical protein